MIILPNCTEADILFSASGFPAEFHPFLLSKTVPLSRILERSAANLISYRSRTSSRFKITEPIEEEMRVCPYKKPSALMLPAPLEMVQVFKSQAFILQLPAPVFMPHFSARTFSVNTEPAPEDI